jgi:mannose-1-phosphate guanylyltransferase
VLGLSNVVVASGPDGILVADKTASPRVKQLMEHFEQRPMCEERGWGSYRLLDCAKFSDGREAFVKRVQVKAGRHFSDRTDANRSEVWVFIKGEGEFLSNDRIMPIKAGDVLQLPAGAKYAVRAASDLELIEVQLVGERTGDDMCRLFLTREVSGKKTV